MFVCGVCCGKYDCSEVEVGMTCVCVWCVCCGKYDCSEVEVGMTCVCMWCVLW